MDAMTTTYGLFSDWLFLWKDGAELGSEVVGPPGAGGDDKHQKAVHFLAKKQNVFSAVSQSRRDGEMETCGGMC